MNYIGEKCPICDQIFTADDDIVVCPDCGTPHHRICYKEKSACANAALHAEGFKWKRKLLREEPDAIAEETIICRFCHQPNKAADENCIRCGSPLSPMNNGAAQNAGAGFQEQLLGGDIGAVLTYMGFDPNEQMDGSTLKEISSFVGPNTLYYIPIFKKMKDLGSKISFNISCLIFPSLYFANRKMWFWAVIAALISVILELPSFLMVMAEGMSDISSAEPFIDMVRSNKGFLTALGEIFGAADWGFKIFYALFGNYLYYRFVVRQLKKLRGQGIDMQTNPSMVISSGGVKPSNIIVIALITAIIGLAALYGVVSCADMLKTLSLF